MLLLLGICSARFARECAAAFTEKQIRHGATRGTDAARRGDRPFCTGRVRNYAVLVHAAALPEYKTLKPAFPRLLGQKLERLRQLKTEAGPLRSHANGVAPLVDKLAPFEDLRHFMAHGIVEVALKQSGEPIYVFRISCTSSDGSTGSTLTLTRPDAQSRTARLAGTVRALVSKLDDIMDGIKKPSKHPVNGQVR